MRVISAVTGEVGAGTKKSDYPSNQAQRINRRLSQGHSTEARERHTSFRSLAVVDAGFQNPPQPNFIENDHVVQWFARNVCQVCDGGFSAMHHVLGHSCLRQLKSQLQQFRVNPRCTPARFGQVHLAN